MAKKLYVGGLSYSTTEDTLKDAFSKAGAVESAVVIMDKISGRSKGFGFVEMATDEEAVKAMEMWNGKELDGRAVKVNEARPMEERPPPKVQSGQQGIWRRRRKKQLVNSKTVSLRRGCFCLMIFCIIKLRIII